VIYVGIDPGKKGAIAVVFSNSFWEVWDMPETNIEIYAILHRLEYNSKNCNGWMVALEEQHHRGPSDRMNGKILTGFMRHYGALEMALAILSVQPIIVNPRTWQADLLGPIPTGDTKVAAMDYVSRCIPKLKVEKSQKVKKSHVDAVCLALWVKQRSKMAER
jgi:hypothetical protein